MSDLRSKIEKLLALSKSSNEHEASLALTLAKKLMESSEPTVPTSNSFVEKNLIIKYSYFPLASSMAHLYRVEVVVSQMSSYDDYLQSMMYGLGYLPSKATARFVAESDETLLQAISTFEQLCNKIDTLYPESSIDVNLVSGITHEIMSASGAMKRPDYGPLTDYAWKNYVRTKRGPNYSSSNYKRGRSSSIQLPIRRLS